MIPFHTLVFQRLFMGLALYLLGQSLSAQALCTGQHVNRLTNGQTTYLLRLGDIDQGSTGGDVFMRFLGSSTLDTVLSLGCGQVYQNIPVELVVLSPDQAIVSRCTTWVYISDPSNACQSANPWPVASCGAISPQMDLAFGGQLNLSAQVMGQGSTGTGLRYEWVSNSLGRQAQLDFDCRHLGQSFAPWLVITDTLGRRDSCQASFQITDSQDFCSPPPSPCQDSGLIQANPNCPLVDAPVCGCDGLTYTNACEAERIYGIRRWTAGPCAAQLCRDSALINPLRFCPSLNQPVCGCDGQTYANACEAEFYHGLRYWTYGVCFNSSTALQAQAYVINAGCGNCQGQVRLILRGGSGNYHYQWADNPNIQDSIRQQLCPGVYQVTVSDSQSGEHIVLGLQVGTASGCVWPGDTDNNSLVNNFDVLAVALTHGESGQLRPNANSYWAAQYAPDWQTVNPVAGLPNYKHIDANGDGMINQADLLVIQQNYTQSYWRNDASKNGNIPLFVEGKNSRQGERLSLPIHLGSATQVAHNIYGLAFTVHYDPALVNAASVGITTSNSWLGNDLLVFEKLFHSQGKIEVAIARKDRRSISHFGPVAEFNITIRDDILRRYNSESMEVYIRNVRLINDLNEELGTNRPSNLVTVGLSTGLEESETQNAGLQLFPNPAQGKVQLHNPQAEIQGLTLFNSLGQELIRISSINSKNYWLDLQRFSAGFYFLEVETTQGLQTQSLQIR